ncbi:MAG: acyl-CoA dehydrogenase family protein [Candidatus Nanopelagicales bacterium]
MITNISNSEMGAMTELTEDQLRMRSEAARVASEVYAPLAEEWDRHRTPCPLDERRRLGRLGYLGIAMPEEFGGAGAPLLDALIVLEEIAKVNRPAAFQIFEANTGPARHLAFFGTEEQKAEVLPLVISGDATVAVAISEPDAGSAATDMTTSIKDSGDELVLSGSKRWISNAGHADYYLVYCRFDDIPRAQGIGAVLVHKDTPGISFGVQERLMGFRGIPSADIYFDDVRLSKSNVVLGPGNFRTLFTGFSIERIGNSTMSLAIGQAALDLTTEYVQSRRQFGREIIEFQSVQTILADMIIKVEAARQLVYRAAYNAGTGFPDPLQVSIAKCTANEMAKQVSDLAIQLHGGNGYSEDYSLERLHRDAHGWAIAGGTPAMQRLRVVSEALGRSFSQRA